VGHVAITVAGTLAILVAAGAGLAVGYLMVTGDGAQAWAIAWPILPYVAPVLVFSSVARVLFGVAPRLMVLAWVPLVFAAVVMLFGELLQLPQWLQDLSPFEHLAQVPAEPFSWTPVLVLALVATALSVAGQFAFARRDVH
jgi:ABC-2 type transport system permease protein